MEQAGEFELAQKHSSKLGFRYLRPEVCALSLSLFLSTGWGQIRRTSAFPESAAAYLSQKHDEYIGSSACGKCHRSIYDTYKQTDMGRSMSAVTPSILGKLHVPATYYDRRADRHYDVYVQDQQLYQSESGKDPSGKDIFRDEHQIHWIIGSGSAVFGGITQRENYLFEAPLAMYTRPGVWELAPGYEFADLGFSRPVLPGCLFCHSGRSKPVTGTTGEFGRTIFSEMAIGCENCHGPGAAHLQAVSRNAVDKYSNLSIVNPATLTSVMANNICMACHEVGDERILKPGKTYQDIRPGTSLDKVLTILMIPPTRKSPPQPDHLQQYYSMTLSKCFRVSAGRLSCITCHDPHVQPSVEEASTYFDSKCMTCHTDQSCRLSRAVRQESRPANNCIGCHMPKREVGFIAHSSLTNHLIRARVDEPFPDSAFSQTTEFLPDLIHLNQESRNKEDSPSLLTLLQAYGDLATYKPEYVAPYLKVLNTLELMQPNNSLVQAALGRRCLKAGKLQEAVRHLKRSLTIGPARSVVFSDLSDAVDKLGQRELSLNILNKAVLQDPFNPTPRRSLIFRLIELNHYAQAQSAMDHYSTIFPQDFYMREEFSQTSKGLSVK